MRRKKFHQKRHKKSNIRNYHHKKTGTGTTIKKYGSSRGGVRL